MFSIGLKTEAARRRMLFHTVIETRFSTNQHSRSRTINIYNIKQNSEQKHSLCQITLFYLPSAAWREGTMIFVPVFVSIFSIFLRRLPTTMGIYSFGTSIFLPSSSLFR